MRVKVKGKIISTEHIWFEQFLSKRQLLGSLPAFRRAQRVCVHGNAVKLTKSSKLQQSLITELDKNDDCILSAFNATIRNEIRRAEKEKVDVSIFTSDDLKKNNAVLACFKNMYEEMYREKCIDARLDNSVGAYIENGKFVLTSAKLYDSEEFCVFHSYLVSDKYSRLLHSCSNFRIQDNFTKNAIGRANRFLHWKDMQYLKSNNIDLYDWGGISSFEEPNGIDRFKLGFGGERVSYYNCTLNLSLVAKLTNVYSRFLKE